ncbi:MAG: transcriptional regulator [Candidatus Zixiibacteriota bacterium]|nr:MAG: transcriptional regulator [candidate division Zixibacteria bacterium]
MCAEAGSPDCSQPTPEIDRIIHEPARLMIVAHLYVVAEADFVFLQRQTSLTRGNLSSHLGKLEEAGYMEISKEFIEKTPHTVLRLTERGRQAFDRYRKNMRDFLSGGPGKA